MPAHPVERAQRGGLDAADVGHDRVPRRQGARDLGADVVGRDRHHDQPGPLAGVRVPGAETGGGPDVLGVAVAEQDLDVAAAQGQAERRAEQPGADDQDRAGQAQPSAGSSGTARTRARSRRSAAAPWR